MWVLATRSRVANCQRFIQAWHDTRASTPVYVRIDHCDPNLGKLLALPWPKEFVVVTGVRARLRASANEMFNNYPNESWYGLLADDVVPRSDYWDQQLVQAATPDKISYAPDPAAIAANKFSMSHPCVGGDLVRLVGWFGCPVVDHFGVSTFWQTLHHQLGWNGAVAAVLEHAHPVYGKAEMDSTYLESLANKYTDLANLSRYIDNNLTALIESIHNKYLNKI